MEISQESHIFSLAISWTADAHSFSPLGHLGGIEALFPQKINTFPNRRKETNY